MSCESHQVKSELMIHVLIEEDLDNLIEHPVKRRQINESYTKPKISALCDPQTLKSKCKEITRALNAS